MKKKYVVLLICVLVVIGSIVAVSAVISRLDSNLKQLAESEITDVDLAGIEDGTYHGSYSSFPITAQVKVTVSGHAITEIELVRHDNGQGAAAESIPGTVIKAQSLRVDAVSGATYSSKVILKAIEDALNQARRK